MSFFIRTRFMERLWRHTKQAEGPLESKESVLVYCKYAPSSTGGLRGEVKGSTCKGLYGSISCRIKQILRHVYKRRGG